MSVFKNIAVKATVAALLLPAPAFAMDGASPEEVLRQRQEIIEGMLTTDRRESIAKTRWLCMNGQEWGSVRDARAEGIDFTPDASDECVAALQRDAKDGQMSYIYQKLVTSLGGNPASSHTLPKAIGNTVLSGDGKVPIGNGLAATVTPQIAFDAGFTVAFNESAAKKNGGDPQKLKAAVEDCMDAKQDAGTCFSVGYVYGAQAVSAQ